MYDMYDMYILYMYMFIIIIMYATICVYTFIKFVCVCIYILSTTLCVCVYLEVPLKDSVLKILIVQNLIVIKIDDLKIK